MASGWGFAKPDSLCGGYKKVGMLQMGVSLSVLDVLCVSEGILCCVFVDGYQLYLCIII